MDVVPASSYVAPVFFSRVFWGDGRANSSAAPWSPPLFIELEISACILDPLCARDFISDRGFAWRICNFETESFETARFFLWLGF